jgi:hypothetical protein
VAKDNTFVVPGSASAADAPAATSGVGAAESASAATEVGKDGRAAILREVAKGLQMPVDDIIPSREKERYLNKIAAQMQAEQAKSGAPSQPDGSPKGGRDANIVSNRDTGRS